MTTDEEKLVTDNMNLAYRIAWAYNRKFSNSIEFDDIKSLCLLGLTKAAKTFKAELGYTFSTYAYRVMQNEILCYFRNNKDIPTVSLSETIEDELELKDIIAAETDVFEEVEKLLNINKLYDEINNLPDRYKKILLYRFKGYTMTKIGNLLGLSQAQISRDNAHAINILRHKFNV